MTLRLTINLRRAALVRSLWCPVCGLAPFHWWTGCVRYVSSG
jgi:hypothetical protein